jgi:hypothetical protein
LASWFANPAMGILTYRRFGQPKCSKHEEQDMDADQTEISQFLKSFQDQFVSGKEICRRAGGKWRFREDPTWALPVLRRMLETRLVETDIDGRFRLTQQTVAPAERQRPRRRMWISPAIQRMLEESGKNFGVLDLDNDPDPDVDVGAITLLPEGQSVAFVRESQ